MLFYSSLLTIILSIILFAFNWKVNKNVGYLALFFTAFACYGLTHHFTLYAQSTFWLAIFYNHFAPLYLLPGPLLYFYTKASLTDKKAFNHWTDFLHFIPAFINLVAIAPYLIVPFSEKEKIASLIIQNLELIVNIKVNWIYPPIVGYMARPILLLVYGSVIFIQLLKFNPKKEILDHIPQQQYIFIKKWILWLSIVACTTAAGFIVLTLNLLQQGISKVLLSAMPIHFGVGIIFFMLPLTLFLFPQILYGMPISIDKVNLQINSSGKTRKRKDIVKDVDPFLLLSTEIFDYLEREKPFVDPDFSMSHIAVIFNVPQHHVAYCFNHLLKKKFSTVRTEFKVNHAKELLDKGLTETLSIDGIGIKAGFVTRSNFYSSFKAITGVTPSEYLENK
ncbi:helix-turn-helix domain-containing protein [Daejeonella sp.]|uniref:AraC family transcriptional regulator n=1 Tax=Daejeonella sp. TaxID=2805397 RepID=UPI0025BAAA1C|nr:helix-turn-helix domain-containing protein [Daejeonella sp.]